MELKKLFPYIIVAVSSAIVTFVITFFAIRTISINSLVESKYLESFGLYKDKPASHVAKVGDYYISLDDFNKEYEILVKASTAGDQEKRLALLNDVNQKKQYLDQKINEAVVVISALNEGFLSSSDWDAISKFSLRKAVFDGYLQKKIDMNSINVSQKEIENFYKERKEYFKQNNIPPDQAEELIKRNLLTQKFYVEVSKTISLLKEKIMIDRNESLIK